jgi:carbon storage regulator CsrA
MLVLSRRLHEKIVFPSIQATVEIVAIKPSVVRVGIQAPQDVPVVRAEIAVDGPLAMESPAAQESAREEAHRLRNRLNTASLGLRLLKKQLQVGLLAGADATIEQVEQALLGIRQQLDDAQNKPVSAKKARRALVVEDDSNERELLAAYLRLAGMDVATAGDGADALDYLHSQHRPDVVLLDMKMPRCDGPSMVRKLRDDPAYANLKIYAVSGYAPDQLGLDPRATGIDHWFRKPINPEALLGRLSNDCA